MVDVAYKKTSESKGDLLVRSLPENWEEMTDAQYLVYCEELCRNQSEEECRLRILQKWMQMSDRQFLRPSVKGMQETADRMGGLSSQYFEKLFPVIDFLFRVPGNLQEGEKTDPSLFTKNFIPKIFLSGKGGIVPMPEGLDTFSLIRGTYYYGPSDKLINLRGEEIEVAENIYAMYHAKKQKDYLVLLVATLYREREMSKSEDAANYDGDLRVPFQANRIGSLAKKYEDLPDYYLHGIRMWYERCMLYWANRHPRVFKPQAASGKPQASDPEAWRKLIRAMAGEKRGTVEDVRRMHLGDMLFELEQLEQEREAYDALVKKMESK